MSITASATRRLIKKLPILLPFLVIVGGLAAYASTSPHEPKLSAVRTEARPALTVGVGGVWARPITQIVVGAGSVAAWQQLIITAEIAGLRIIDITVEEGDHVTKGQMLARLDDSILQAQLAQFEAAIKEAEANTINAQADFRRAQQLQASRNIAEAVFQQRQTAVQASDARLAMIRAQRDEVKARIAQTLVRAPTDGLIAQRSALVGTASSVGAELFRMIRDGRVELQARVPELDLGKVRTGQPVRVVHGDDAIKGRVRLVSPVVDAGTRLGLVYVELPEDGALKPGMFANAEIAVGTAEALAVPQEALVFRDGRPAAFAVGADNRVSTRVLATGARQDGWVEVRNGLGRGDRIVVTGAGFLNDGDLVRIENAAAPPPSIAR